MGKNCRGCAKGNPKAETYIKYGVTDRGIGNEHLEKHGNFDGAGVSGIHEGDVVIDGRYVYATYRKSIESGYTETDAYLDTQRKSGARFSPAQWHIRSSWQLILRPLRANYRS